MTWAPPERGHSRGYTVRWRQQLREETGEEADIRGVDTDDTWLLGMYHKPQHVCTVRLTTI